MKIRCLPSGLSIQISGSLNKTTLIVLKIPLLHLYIKKKLSAESVIISKQFERLQGIY